ncbi:MAG: Na+/H+ antiporter subunit G [Aquificota bacterium]|jgi:multicomponent Na+:H+ antiporter subunit G|nr:MAG: Na+/H+ antiporter subunit G [Aquificota bacterium]
MTILEVLSLSLMFVGAFFLLAGSMGLLRLRDTYSRLHALTKADLLGFGFVVLGVMVSAKSLSEVLKLLIIWLFVIVYSSLVGYAIAHQKRKRGDA